MWSLIQDKKELKPLIFSNGKTQEDVVREVIKAAEEGHKIIFIKGMCGTGKSAIALNLARHFGKTSIVVPIKSLQEQYSKDYTEKLQVLDKKTKNPLKIASIFGRKNFKCKFLEETTNLNENSIKENPRLSKETNARLFDIFKGSEPIKKPSEDSSCDNIYLPCKIEIKEKNSQMIRSYITQNPLIKKSDFSSINEVKRMSIAPICPYWSPIIPSEIDINFKDSQKISYTGLNNIPFTIHLRKPGCKYYEQHLNYANANVIIFNSLKYKLETLMNRKPHTELEIIDECDEFLDSFANQEKVNLNRLLFALNMVFPENNKIQEIINELIGVTNKIKKDYAESSEIYPIDNTPIKELLLVALKNKDLIHEVEVDDSNYIYHLDEVARIFFDFLDETYFSVEKQENDLVISLVTTNLKKRFKELVEKNKILVMMSGTIHSEKVLKNIFGLENFKIIDAEVQQQGELINCKHGYELNCSYNSFKNNTINRETFLKIFSKTVSCAKLPLLVHLTSFSDLPSEYEKELYGLDNLPVHQDLIQEQNLDPLGQRIKDFKDKKFPVLFTTKCSRGIDFPGDTCNSIIISRFPYPNISSIFWKILKKTNPEHFMEFYLDKANRELLQKIYRGLRSKFDKVYLLSPDIRVLESKIG
jgi:Rad3-related DNA helicase